MAKIIEMFNFNRDQARELKAMSQKELSEYVNSVYTKGHLDGFNESADAAYQQGAERQGAFMLEALTTVLVNTMELGDEQVQNFMQHLSLQMKANREEVTQ